MMFKEVLEFEVGKIPGGVCLNLKDFYSAFRQRKTVLIFLGSQRLILVQG